MSNASHTPPGQAWNAGRYAEHASFVPDLGTEVLRLLSPQPGQRILDVGCGDGALTERIMQLRSLVDLPWYQFHLDAQFAA